MSLIGIKLNGTEVPTKAGVSLFQQAIAQKSVVCFFYKDDVRVVVPHAVGEASFGDYKVRAWQLYPEAGWRMFDVEKIKAPTFEGQAVGYKRDDKDMKASILAQL